MKRVLVVLVAALALGACGSGDSAGDAALRTVEVEMVDIAFKPTSLSIAKGETVEFVFKNTGRIDHDAFVGDRKAQDAHEAEMRGGGKGDKGHGDGGDHDDDAADAVTVKPGKTERLKYTFDTAGTVEIGCHQPGHYEAGMKVTVAVA